MVCGCVVLFFILFLTQSGYVKILEEISEEIFLIMWSAFQSLRMLLIVKKQKMASQSAKSSIDFTLDIDTEVDENKDGSDPEEVIVFDMKKIEQKQN